MPDSLIAVGRRRQRRLPWQALSACIALLLAMPAFVEAQSVPYATIKTELSAGSQAQTNGAVTHIRTDLEEEPRGTVNHLCDEWLRVLYEQRRFSDVESLSLRGIELYPSETPWVAAMERWRAEALLGLHRPDEALACAKSAFNVCPMYETRDTLLLVAECLNAAHPDDPAIVDRLRDQQVAGEGYPSASASAKTIVDAKTDMNAKMNSQSGKGPALITTQPASAPATRLAESQFPNSPLAEVFPDHREVHLPPVPDVALANVSPLMKDVHVDPSVYDRARQALYGTQYVFHLNEFRDLCGQGNLLLLADRSRDAEGVFREALGVAEESDRLIARENLARAIRAEDGTIGRANAWVKAVRQSAP